MSKDAASTDQLGQTTTRQFGEDVAPEEAAQDEVGLVGVPREALLVDIHSIRR